MLDGEGSDLYGLVNGRTTTVRAAASLTGPDCLTVQTCAKALFADTPHALTYEGTSTTSVVQTYVYQQSDQVEQGAWGGPWMMAVSIESGLPVAVQTAACGTHCVFGSFSFSNYR